MGNTTMGWKQSSATTQTTVNPQTEVDVASPPQEQAALTPIPKDVTYTIIDENTILGVKRSLDLRLNRKVSMEVLKSIAMKLKNLDSNKYERTFIEYYLPGTEIGAGAWATTHFNPKLEVRILSLTVEQEKALKQQPEDQSQK